LLTPAQYAQSVDHGGVRVGAHHAVGVHQAVGPDVDHAAQLLQVDLVHGAHLRRDHVHVAERFGAPLAGKKTQQPFTHTHFKTHFTVLAGDRGVGGF